MMKALMKSCFISLLLSCLLISRLSLAKMANDFALAVNCPPSFELVKKQGKNSVCRLVNLYQFYDSVQGRGLGGTQTSLPKNRDGFTPAQIDLGRYLFFDPLLSKDGSISCASCHQPDKGFSDDLDRSIGITGKKVGRSAPSLWNVAFLDKFFWDARATTLEQQAQGPLFDPLEMGNTPEQLLSSINANQIYVAMFAQAFPDAKQVNVEQVYTALTAFQTSLISLNSRYDRYAHGYHQALNENEIKGLNIFRSFVARCAECHQPPLFTNNQVAVIGTPEPDGRDFDIGAQKTYADVEHSEKLRGGFKVPTLRNITKTAPYMHSGKFDKLYDAVEFYSKGRGHAVPKDEKLQLHWHIWEPDLTDEEMQLIVDFLGSLTDESLAPEIPTKLPSGLPVVDEKYQSGLSNNRNLKRQLSYQAKNYKNNYHLNGEEDE